MLNLLDTISHLLGYLFFISFTIFWVYAVIIIGHSPNANGEFFFFIRMLKKLKFGVFFATFALMSFILSCSTSLIFEKLIREEIREKASPHFIKSILINGELAKNDSLLMDISNIWHPNTKRKPSSIEINLTLIGSQDSLPIRLERYEYDSTLYWVYCPNFETSDLNCVGRVRTKHLNIYQPEHLLKALPSEK
ncbi:hypothetical protein [uncultured Arcticibacterium sp.]|uniref:hypothetical protein n=1 Tax=uncultured Arcticibacterium sp. TaxID=2173042 RepID=UPI0030FCC3E7